MTKMTAAYKFLGNVFWTANAKLHSFYASSDPLTAHHNEVLEDEVDEAARKLAALPEASNAMDAVLRIRCAIALTSRTVDSGTYSADQCLALAALQDALAVILKSESESQSRLQEHFADYWNGALG